MFFKLLVGLAAAIFVMLAIAGAYLLYELLLGLRPVDWSPTSWKIWIAADVIAAILMLLYATYHGLCWLSRRRFPNPNLYQEENGS
jgi:hypothetical protein